jgi:hypothetical protein
MLFVVPLPMRIQTIYICNYYIHSYDYIISV